ncbi:unnamed protein product [marine sediment metagenome]|uniref:Uncharacterized protein n=1 Tax=marine sediment metagenome TaxID=412755 RepID=X0U1W3_9ZZZZ
MRTIISNLNFSEIEDILTTCYKYTPGKPGSKKDFTLEEVLDEIADDELKKN